MTEDGFPVLSRVLPSLLMIGLAGQATAAPPRAMSSHEEALRQCRLIAEDLARVRCYDDATAKLLAARERGELALIDKRQAQEVRRSLFGFAVPNLGILGGSEEGAAKELTAKVSSARAIGNRRFRVRLDNGATWETTEGSRTGEEPRAGSTVRIRKAALGSYFMNIDGYRAVRARRAE